MTILEILTFKDFIKTLKNNLSEHNQHLNTGLHSDYTHHHEHKSFHLHQWAAFLTWVARLASLIEHVLKVVSAADSRSTLIVLPHSLKFTSLSFSSASQLVVMSLTTRIHIPGEGRQPGNRPTDWVWVFVPVQRRGRDSKESISAGVIFGRQ